MSDPVEIINYIQLSLFIVLFSLALLYIISLLFIGRFRHTNNILTINFCLAVICSTTYWTYFYITFLFYPENFQTIYSCNLLTYFEMMTTIEIPFATVVVSIYRFCSIVYHRKRFFRQENFVKICISCQWLIGILISLPRYRLIGLECTPTYSSQSYTLVMVVILPSLISSTINLIIFHHVRRSSNRIQVNNIDDASTVAVTNNTNMKIISRRDLRLLRHIIFIFCVFIGGWSPVYIYSVISPSTPWKTLTLSLLILLAESSLFIDVINLFIYNRELRRRLTTRFCKYQ